jgi:hypothetical protein
MKCIGIANFSSVLLKPLICLLKPLSSKLLLFYIKWTANFLHKYFWNIIQSTYLNIHYVSAPSVPANGKNRRRWRKLQKPITFGVSASNNHQFWGNFQKPTSFHVESGKGRWPVRLGRLTCFMIGWAHLSGGRGSVGTCRSRRPLWHAWPT